VTVFSFFRLLYFFRIFVPYFTFRCCVFVSHFYFLSFACFLLEDFYRSDDAVVSDPVFFFNFNFRLSLSSHSSVCVCVFVYVLGFFSLNFLPGGGKSGCPKLLSTPLFWDETAASSFSVTF